MAEYLNRLSKKEFRLLDKFLRSPLFNTHRTILKYFDFMQPLYPGISADNTSKKEIHKFIYGRKKFSRANIQKVESDFGKLFDRFLIYVETGNDEVRDIILLLKSLRKRKMYDRYSRTMRSLNQKQSEIFSKNDQYYLMQINIGDEIINAKFPGSEEKGIIEKKSININNYFILQNLVSYLQLIIADGGGSVNCCKFENSMYGEVMNYTEKNLKKFMNGHPNIIVTYSGIKMYAELEDVYYDKLIGYYKRYKNKLSTDTIKYIFVILSIFRRMIKFKNRGDYRSNNRKLSELHDLMYIKTDLYQEYFSEGREMDVGQFLNIVHTSIELGKKNWLKKFYERHHMNLNKHWKKDAERYLLAGDHFINGDLTNALIRASEISHRNSRIFSDSRMLICMILFEMNDAEFAGKIIRNFRKFNKTSTRLPGSVQSKNADFIKYYAAFLKIRLTKKIAKRNDYKQLLDRMDKGKISVFFREWFERIYESEHG